MLQICTHDKIQVSGFQILNLAPVVTTFRMQNAYIQCSKRWLSQSKQCKYVSQVFSLSRLGGTNTSVNIKASELPERCWIQGPKTKQCYICITLQCCRCTFINIFVSQCSKKCGKYYQENAVEFPGQSHRVLVELSPSLKACCSASNKCLPTV